MHDLKTIHSLNTQAQVAHDAALLAVEAFNRSVIDNGTAHVESHRLYRLVIDAVSRRAHFYGDQAGVRQAQIDANEYAVTWDLDPTTFIPKSQWDGSDVGEYRRARRDDAEV